MFFFSETSLETYTTISTSIVASIFMPIVMQCYGTITKMMSQILEAIQHDVLNVCV